MTMLKFYNVDRESVAGYMNHFETALCDRDPAVMGVSLNAYLTFILVSLYHQVNICLI